MQFQDFSTLPSPIPPHALFGHKVLDVTSFAVSVVRDTGLCRLLIVASTV